MKTIYGNMDTMDESKIVIQPLPTEWYGSKVAAVDMLRLDLLHPIISGNKWYKLRLNVMYAKDNGYQTIVTFGGGYSNHLAATAFTAKIAGLNSVGIVRGKYDTLTPTLEECIRDGMKLIFVTKEDYNRKGEPEWEQELVRDFDNLFIVPEGGANEWGRKGAGLISFFIKPNYTHVLLAVGTGTTMAGIRNKTNVDQAILGFAPMKGGAYLKDHIEPHLYLAHNVNWEIFDQWHFGGFGKWNDDLINFINDFYLSNQIPLDIVYTSKMMFGVRELINSGYFKPTDRLLCIHSGGLQGNVTVKERLFSPGNFI